VSAPTLDVVIVSYRCRELLRACLNSFREHGPAGARIVVVDNASGDGTVDMLQDDFPEVEAIANGHNAGFAAANNVAIRRGTAPYVLVLNPDTRLTEPLEPLLELMEERPEVGICGCRLVREDGTFDHAARRGFPTPMGALAHFTGIGRRRWAPRALAQYRAPEVEEGQVDAVNGAFMLMSRAALDEVGLFDEGYWMYMEDLDLCYRFARAGWVTWYEPTVEVVHRKHGTSGELRSPLLLYHFHRGMHRFYRKHHAGRRPPFDALVYAGIAAKLGLALAAWGARAPGALLGRPARTG
jgi:N-acetylglucosaminyl-diphospho-decaprenol L-rhamnosyltransferase